MANKVKPPTKPGQITKGGAPGIGFKFSKGNPNIKPLPPRQPPAKAGGKGK